MFQDQAAVKPIAAIAIRLIAAAATGTRVIAIDTREIAIGTTRMATGIAIVTTGIAIVTIDTSGTIGRIGTTGMKETIAMTATLRAGGIEAIVTGRTGA